MCYLSLDTFMDIISRNFRGYYEVALRHYKSKYLLRIYNQIKTLKMPKIQSIEVINDSEENVNVLAEFQSGKSESRNLKGKNDQFMLGKEDMESKHPNDPLRRLVFKYKDRTE